MASREVKIGKAIQLVELASAGKVNGLQDFPAELLPKRKDSGSYLKLARSPNAVADAWKHVGKAFETMQFPDGKLALQEAIVADCREFATRAATGSGVDETEALARLAAAREARNTAS